MPYAIILIQALEKWKASHGGQVPKNFTEKNEFKASIKTLNKFGGKAMNFPEAEQNAIECYKTDEMKHHIKAVFDRLNGTQTSTFWLCVAALKQFFETEGRLPLSGTLPDMVSTTDYYL